MIFSLLINLFFGVFIGVVAGKERPLVQSVEFLGSIDMTESRARALLVTRPGMPIDSVMIRNDLKRLLSGYRERGYWQVLVSFPEIRYRSGRVVFSVEPGEITRINRILIEGNDHVSHDVLLKVITAGPGAALIETRIEDDLHEMLAVYSNAGYPYCAINPRVDLLPGQDTVSVQYAISEGPLVEIDGIRFEGNQVTRRDVLLREMRIREGERYNQTRIDRGVEYLSQLAFLLNVDDPVLREDRAGRTTLVVRVREAPSGRLEGGLGYAGDTGGSTRGLTGVFALEFDNFKGTARSGKALWGKQGPSTSKLGLSYREPWFLGFPISVGINLDMQQRPAYTEHRLDAYLKMSLSPGKGLGLGTYYQEVRPDSNGIGAVSRSRVGGLEGIVEYDGRDDRFNPRRGIQTGVNVSWGSVRIGGSRRDRVAVRAHLGTFLPFGRHSVSALSIHGALVTQENGVPQEARFRIGGSETIRGQREEAFLATHAIWANLEWRYILGRRSRIFLFLDTGVLNDPAADGQRRLQMPFGFGGGIRATSGIGLLGLDYGLGKGDGPAQGKVHVRMVNEF